MAEPRVVRNGSHALLFDAGREQAAVEWFDRDRWQRDGAVAIETSGRGAALVVDHGAERWVLRHYRRGGFVARFIDDHYLWLGLERTRAFREWRLLRDLRDAGLPVPNPVAAHVRLAGAVYTADILTIYLPDTRKLSSFIAERGVPPECWSKIGRMLRAVHDRGVDHPDLTAHNILVDSHGAVFLVDFDNAHVRDAGAWRRAGLERLQRSLRKVALETATSFDAAAWRELTSAYDAGGPL